MGKVRVAVANTIGKTVVIDPAGTVGATIGTDLKLPDGTTPTLAELAAALAAEADPAQTFPFALWGRIQEIPANITAIAAISTNGLLTRKVDGSWVTRSIAVGSAKLTVVNGDGDAGNPTVDFGSVASGDLSDVDLTGVLNNDFLFRSGGNWIPTAGDVTWDTTTFKVAGAVQVEQELKILTDITTPTPPLNDLVDGSLKIFDADNTDFLARFGFLGSADLFIQNFIRSGSVNFQATGTGGSVITYLTCDPDAEILFTAVTGFRLRVGAGANAIRAFNAGAVDVYHNNVLKLSTRSTGINIVGDMLTARGSESDAAHSFTLDPDTGGFSPGANIYAITVGATEAVRYTEASSEVLMDNSMETGITASTTQTQGERPLLSSYNEISIVANNNDVVTIPPASKGRSCLVINKGTKTLQVFPTSGDDLGQGVDASDTIKKNTSLLFVAFDATTWHEVATKLKNLQDVNIDAIPEEQLMYQSGGIMVSTGANLCFDGTTLTASAFSGPLGGIAEANLVDKTAPEIISGQWTHSGRLITDDSTTSRAGFNIPTGVAPTSPVQGDMWVEATNAFIRINGVNESLLNVGGGGDNVYRIGHTYAIVCEIKVPSGQDDFIIPFFVSLVSGQTAKLVKARHIINDGTSVTCKLQKNGSDITGFTGISVTTTTADTDPADVTLANNDKLALVVTAVSGTPKNMSFTIFIEYTQ